jgi:hypothetical protein
MTAPAFPFAAHGQWLSGVMRILTNIAWCQPIRCAPRLQNGALIRGLRFAMRVIDLWGCLFLKVTWRIRMATALLTALGLGLANFAYQGLTAQDWALAIERTWFQWTACLAVAVAQYFKRQNLTEHEYDR